MCSEGNSRSQFKNKVQGFLESTIDEMDVAAYGSVLFLLADMKMKVPSSLELLAQSHPFFPGPFVFCK